MLSEMARLMSEQGAAFVMDLTRLKAFNCVQKYVQLMGQE
jgi:hypothetical protein